MLEFKNISVAAGKTKILEDVSLKIHPHSITALIGKNAAGKSTLLSCLTGETKYRGSITFDGKNLSDMSARERARLISLLPQKLPCPEISGGHLIRLGRTPHLDIGRHFTAEDKALCKKAAELTDTSDLLDKKLSVMSGGERQKIYFAMLLSQNTPIVALDEPTSYMDAQHEREFSALLKTTVEKEKKTALVVMHDLTRAVEIADYIAILDNGKVVFYGTSRECTESGLIESTFGVKAYSCDGLIIYR